MSNTPVQEINIPYPEPEYDKETCKEYHARVVALGFPFEKLTQKHQTLYCKRWAAIEVVIKMISRKNKQNAFIRGHFLCATIYACQLSLSMSA